MEILLDCIPCMLRQALEASRLATDRVDVQEKIMEDAIRIISHYKDYQNSPDLCQAMHQTIKRRTLMNDPYAEIKRRDIDAAKKILPGLINFLKDKKNSLYWALKISATGNIIDSAVNKNADMMGCMKEELEKSFSRCDLEQFENRLESAKSILIIGDNAGETVFDRVLAERLSQYDLTFAVRSEPVINDATAEDAYASGLADYARIISTGCGAPGAVLADCGRGFLKQFEGADIVISKGQGNFEALSECDRPVFFLLKAKCPVISQKLKVCLNDYVFQFKPV